MTDVKTPPVVATLCQDIDSVKGKPGAFEFYSDSTRGIAGMIYACPCGCKRLGSLAFRPARLDDHASWEWNGNKEKPTLTPSVHHVGHWHGFLTDGVWVSC